MPIKLALVGCGNIAAQYYGPSLLDYASKHPDLELSACCDNEQGKASWFAQQFGFKQSYTDLDEMLDKVNPGSILLLVPYQYSKRLAVKILENYKSALFIEKPPGINLTEAQMIQTTAEIYGNPVMAAFNRRYMPIVRKLVDRLKETGSYARLHHIQYELIRFQRKDEDFSTTAIHGIDTSRFVAGADFSNLHFQYQELPHLGQGVANFHLYGKFNTGATVGLQFLPLSGANIERITVHGQDRLFCAELPMGSSINRQGILYEYVNGVLINKWTGHDLGDSEDYKVNGFYGGVTVFLDHVRNGSEPKDSIAFALQSIDVAEFIRRREKEYRQ